MFKIKMFQINICTALILIIIGLIFNYVRSKFHYWTSKNVRHPEASFPFGNFNSNVLTKLGEGTEKIYFELRKTGQKYGGYNLLTIPVFMPLDPELYKLILTKNFTSFHDHGIYCDEENDPMSAHLVSLSGAKWRTMRTKLTPAFTITKIKAMFPLIKKCCSDLSEILNKSSSIALHDLATRYTTDVICSCAFGIECGSLKNPKAEFRRVGRRLVELDLFGSLRFAFTIMGPQILSFFKICSFNPRDTGFFYKIVEETIAYREKNNIQRNDLMDLLIKLKHNENIDDDVEMKTNNQKMEGFETGLTLNQIASQVFLFYLAGFESSATTISFAMYYLAKNPDIQNNVRNEILNLVKENGGDLDYEALGSMKYTDRVIYETLRLHPPIEMLNRICTENFQLPNSDLIIEKGTRIVIGTRGVHHDPEYYPNPDIFDPERFTEEQKSKRPPFTYLPFGEGPRICLGMKFALLEVKLALSVFLRNHKFTINPKTKSKIETVSNGNLLGFKDEIYLNLEKL